MHPTAGVVDSTALDSSVLTPAGVRRGIVKTLPFGVSSVAFGTAFGVLSGSMPGIGAAGALLMSASVYSGSAQMVGLDLWSSHAGMLAIWATTLLVSLRYVLLGLTMRSWFADMGRWVVLTVPFTMSDEVWALTHNEFRHSRRDLGFFLGSGLTMLVCWTSGTAIGLILGSKVPDPVSLGIDFVATAAFTGLIAGMATSRRQVLPWGTAAMVAIVAERWLPGQWYILLGAFAGLLVGVVVERKHHDVQ